ncbi:hypothetical protein DYB34_005951 [Aphanomyces astaci]|uniref:Amidase domain-containing protein n=1 Tax=Aphanomyces astaci TaxID=112090 RepID=A0A3R6WHG2_APHAT|nr:hypothetical protein DYB34_005951 [Aphanomyces astaci]
MFVATTFDSALAQASESDARRRDGRARGPLDGIPVGVKDIFCMQNGVPTTASSKILQGFVAPYESTATQRLLDAGAIPLGKLNMDEFAMGSGTTYSTFGPTINPWSSDLGDRALVAGGSSGASAAAVASGCCFAALGSDTGGSPAAYCGVTGLKPNYGRISRHGMIAFASSLDTPGILAKTIRYVEVYDAAAAAVADASNNQANALHDLYCRTRSEGFGDEVQRRILSGTFVLSAGALADYYERAVLVRQTIRDDFASTFESGIDVLLTPTTPSGPFAVHGKANPVDMFMNDIMTIPASLAGLPSVSVPAAVLDQMPLGLQLIGAPHQEHTLLHVAHLLEQRADFYRHTPSRVLTSAR